jgi:hypothetical protein
MWHATLRCGAAALCILIGMCFCGCGTRRSNGWPWDLLFFSWQLLYRCRHMIQRPSEGGIPGGGGVGQEAPHSVDCELQRGPGVFGVSVLVVENFMYSFVEM